MSPQAMRAPTVPSIQHLSREIGPIRLRRFLRERSRASEIRWLIIFQIAPRFCQHAQLSF